MHYLPILRNVWSNLGCTFVILTIQFIKIYKGTHPLEWVEHVDRSKLAHAYCLEVLLAIYVSDSFTALLIVNKCSQRTVVNAM